MAVLLAYNLTSDFAASTVASGVTGATLTNNLLSNFIRSSGLGYGSEPVGIVNPPGSTTSAALAVTNGSYFYFSITPDAGKQISLTTLTFNMARGGASTPRGYQVRSSVDAFAASLGGGDINTARPTFTAVSIDLSGASFQNVSTTITFNIYIYAPTSSNSLDFDDVVVNGTVADLGTVELEGYRWRDDDGSETTASWLAAQDTNITQAKSTNTRLRVVLNATDNPPSQNYQLEVRKVGDTDWTVIST